MVDIEQVLREGNTILIKPQGYSMYPLFVPGRDSAVIAPLGKRDRLRRGDVILYRRDGGILVLHRIFRISKKGLYLVGDNQTEIEGPLRTDQVRGRLVGFVRNGRKHSVRFLPYLCYSHLWLLLRPCRHRIAVFVHRLKEWMRWKN